MQERIPGIRCFAGLPLVLLVALGSAAQEVEPAAGNARSRAVERWVPGLSIVGLGHIQGRSGSIESPERGSHSGSTRSVFASLGLSAELSTPVLSFAPGRPRLFFHGDAALSFETEEPLINEGDPGEIVLKSVGGSVVTPVDGALGRGSATRVDTQSPIVSAGLGLACELPLGDRNLRLKPSVEWQWQKDRIRQLFGDVKSNGTDPDSCAKPSCRTLEIDATLTEGFHSLGPGLEIEIDAARIGDFILTVYASGRAYRLLGSRGFELETVGFWQTNGTPNPTEGGPGIPPETVRPPSTILSTYERDPWHYALGVGIRFLWRPE